MKPGSLFLQNHSYVKVGFMSISENLERVKESLERAVQKAGRSSGEVELMAVSKTKPVEMILEAYQAGQRVFGENRVIEAEEKFQKIPSDARVELIGHLQSNKIKTAASVFHRVQTIDSLKLVEKLHKRCEEIDRPLEVLLQLKTSQEVTKTGFENLDALRETLDTILDRPYLKVCGLMTIAPFTDDETTVRRAFAVCREARDRLESHYGNLKLPVLSMGMSDDFEWAVLEGSTQVRVGSAIFGARY